MTSILANAAGRFDVAVVRLAQALARRQAGAGPSHGERLQRLDETARAYQAIPAEQFFAAPPAPRGLTASHVRDLPLGGECVDLQWESGWQPQEPLGRAGYLAFAENRFAQARLLRHARPSPAIICLHGYRAGVHRLEELAWNAMRLYRLGLDVALLTLPFHARRAPRGRLAPMFPSARTGRTVEGFGQAVWDLRALLGWLRARGAPHVGVAGMSLGGYTAALAATVEPRLDFAVLFIPLGDLTDVAVEHEALRGQQIPEALREAGKRALQLIRPLARKPVIPGSRILVVAAKGDRITALETHAVMLARHFSAPLVTFPGGHLIQLGRQVGFAAMDRLLESAGVLQP